MRTLIVLFKNTINTFHYVPTDDNSQMVPEIQYTDDCNVVNEFFERVLDTFTIY